MKKLSIKEVIELMKQDVFIFVRINTITKEIRVVNYNTDDTDGVLGYLTFNQYLKFTSNINTYKNTFISSFSYHYYRYFND